MPISATPISDYAADISFSAMPPMPPLLRHAPCRHFADIFEIIFAADDAAIIFIFSPMLD
jgi:hypothetical protein